MMFLIAGKFEMEWAIHAAWPVYTEYEISKG